MKTLLSYSMLVSVVAAMSLGAIGTSVWWQIIRNHQYMTVKNNSKYLTI